MIFLAHAYIGTGNQKRMKAEPLGIGSSGAVLGKIRKERDSREDNHWLARCLLLPQHNLANARYLMLSVKREQFLVLIQNEDPY